MIPEKATNPSDSTEYSVVGIDYGAFYYATSLNSVTLPEGLEYIDSCAFQNSSLKSIEIPASVTRLGSEDKHRLSTIQYFRARIVMILRV